MSKIKNAKSKTYNNIKFKSISEISVYKTLISEGFKPNYEAIKFTIWKGFYPTIPFYKRTTKLKEFKLRKEKIKNITYTPDFTFTYKGYLIIVEVKGFENDIFPIKCKLFRKYLEEYVPNALYFEVFTVKETKELIKCLNQLKN